MNRIIGLTGGISSGKSTVARILEEKGFYRIDADRITRDIYAPGGVGSAVIKKEFGEKLGYPKWFVDFVCKKDAEIRYKRITEDFGEQDICLEGKRLSYPTIFWRVLYRIYDLLDFFKFRNGL